MASNYGVPLKLQAAYRLPNPLRFRDKVLLDGAERLPFQADLPYRLRLRPLFLAPKTKLASALEKAGRLPRLGLAGLLLLPPLGASCAPTLSNGFPTSVRVEVWNRQEQPAASLQRGSSSSTRLFPTISWCPQLRTYSAATEDKAPCRYGLRRTCELIQVQLRTILLVANQVP